MLVIKKKPLKTEFSPHQVLRFIYHEKLPQSLIPSLFSVEDYVHCLVDSKGIEDKISRLDCAFDDNTKELFPCHLTPVQIHDGIKKGTLLQGSFQASRENFLEGQVNVEGFEKPVCIDYKKIL